MILIVRVHITLQNVSVHITDSTRETLSSLLPVGTLSTSLYFHTEGGNGFSGGDASSGSSHDGRERWRHYDYLMHSKVLTTLALCHRILKNKQMLIKDRKINHDFQEKWM